MFGKLVLLGCLAALPAAAQYVEGDAPGPKPVNETEEKGTFWDRLNYGGNFGAQFGTYTSIDISPTVTYRVTDKFWVGPGATYVYQSIPYGGKQYSFSTFGGRAIARYQILDQFFLHGEVESLSVPLLYANANGDVSTNHVWYTSPLLGGGYYSPFGRTGSGLFVTALYNFNYAKAQGLYPSPLVLRIGFAL